MNADNFELMRMVELFCFRRGRSARSSVDSGAPRSYFGDDGFGIEELDASSLYGSQYSFCSCTHCEDHHHHNKKNPLYGRTDLRLSICER